MARTSAAAAGPKTGAVKPAPPINPLCEELKEHGEEGREELKGATRDQSVIGEKGTGRGTTVSTCEIRRGGPATIRMAHSNQKANDKCPSSFVSGGDEEVRSGDKKGLCGHVHPDPAMQKSGHAEARLMDDMAGKKMPAQVTFNIDWRKRKGRPSKMPCKTCHDYMCKVKKKCGVNIQLCDKKGRSHEVPCPANTENRKALKKSLDGAR
jgi:hypothetical protein